MIVHLDKEQTKQERRRLLGNNDVVYIIFHDMLKMWQKEGVTTLSPVELFLSAKNFANTLLQLPDVMEGVDDEMDDLEDETEGENDAMIIMMLASAMLHAVGTHRVGFDSKPVIMAIYGKWCDHQLFFPFMDEGAKKEQARYVEGKKTNLLAYELKNIDDNDQIDDSNLISVIVDSAIGLSVEAMQHVENALSETNDKFGHRYDDDLKRLREARKKKSVSNINIDRVNDIHDNPNVNIGGK